jgi:uncharacterized membrane protein
MDDKNYFKVILGGIIVVGFFSVLITLMITGKNDDALYLMIGALIGSFTTIKDYFFGSSSSSAKKDETISSLTTNNVTNNKKNE